MFSLTFVLMCLFVCLFVCLGTQQRPTLAGHPQGGPGGVFPLLDRRGEPGQCFFPLFTLVISTRGSCLLCAYFTCHGAASPLRPTGFGSLVVRARHNLTPSFPSDTSFSSSSVHISCNFVHLSSFLFFPSFSPPCLRSFPPSLVPIRVIGPSCESS